MPNIRSLSVQADPEVEFCRVGKVYKPNLESTRRHAMLSLAGARRLLRRGKNDVDALNDISFRVGSGETLLILGGAKAGKTAIARLIAGLTTPTSGEVRVRGRVCLLSAKKTGATPLMNVAQFCRLRAAMNMMVSPDPSLKPWEFLLQVCDLWDVRRTQLHDIEGGDLRAISFLAALHTGCEICVFDGHPRTKVGDDDLNALCRDRLETVLETKTCVVLQSTGRRLPRSPDRAMLLYRGEVLLEGSSDLAYALHRRMVRRLDRARSRGEESPMAVDTARSFLRNLHDVDVTGEEVGPIAVGMDRVLRAVDKIETALTSSEERIIVGPYLGTRFAEIAYWIPFVLHARRRLGIDTDRLVAVSVGDMGSYYREIGDQYVDVLDIIDPVSFQDRLEERRQETGKAKQLSRHELDEEISARVAERWEASQEWQLHPWIMYWFFTAAWSDSVAFAFTQAHVEPPAHPPALERSDESGGKLLFYLDRQPVLESSELASRYFDRLRGRIPSQSIGRLEYTEGGWIRADSADSRADPWEGWVRDETATLAKAIRGARAIIGPLSGTALLAASMGVPVLALYSPAVMKETHKQLLGNRRWPARLELVELTEASLDAAAERATEFFDDLDS